MAKFTQSLQLPLSERSSENATDGAERQFVLDRVFQHASIGAVRVIQCTCVHE
jgi:hypothetical protein